VVAYLRESLPIRVQNRLLIVGRQSTSEVSLEVIRARTPSALLRIIQSHGSMRPSIEPVIKDTKNPKWSGKTGV
jgi:hypothetical protein